MGQPTTRRIDLTTLFVTLAIHVGCVTTPDEPPKLPAVLDPIFVNCTNRDGAAVVQVFEKGAFLGKAELEWISEDRRSWTAEVTSPIGQSLIRLTRKGGTIDVSGQLAESVPKLTEREDGFLEVDGYLIGFKGHEVPCLLAYQLPRQWLPHLRQVTGEGAQRQLLFEDEVRTVKVTVQGLKRKRGWGRVCTELSWSQYVGLVRTDVEWCQSLAQKKQQAVLRGLGEFELKWDPLDDG